MIPNFFDPNTGQLYDFGGSAPPAPIYPPPYGFGIDDGPGATFRPPQTGAESRDYRPIQPGDPRYQGGGSYFGPSVPIDQLEPIGDGTLGFYTNPNDSRFIYDKTGRPIEENRQVGVPEQPIYDKPYPVPERLPFYTSPGEPVKPYPMPGGLPPGLEGPHGFGQMGMDQQFGQPRYNMPLMQVGGQMGQPSMPQTQYQQGIGALPSQPPTGGNGIADLAQQQQMSARRLQDMAQKNARFQRQAEIEQMRQARRDFREQDNRAPGMSAADINPMLTKDFLRKQQAYEMGQLNQSAPDYQQQLLALQQRFKPLMQMAPGLPGQVRREMQAQGTLPTAQTFTPAETLPTLDALRQARTQFMDSRERPRFNPQPVGQTTQTNIQTGEVGPRYKNQRLGI